LGSLGAVAIKCRERDAVALIGVSATAWRASVNLIIPSFTKTWCICWTLRVKVLAKYLLKNFLKISSFWRAPKGPK